MTKYLTKYIIDLIDLADLISVSIDSKMRELSTNEELVDLDKNILSAENFLLNEDLKRIINQINSAYKISLLCNVDLEINDDLKKKLEYLKSTELIYYINSKEGLVAKNPQMIDLIKTKFNEKNNSISKNGEK